jgi:hypothetical protein
LITAFYLRIQNSTMKFKYRNYQNDIINKSCKILSVPNSNYVYLSMEVRTGKTLTALGVAQKMNADRVLFVTRKKAISSIESDYELLNADFNLFTINYESLHKINNIKFDIIVLDEAHSLGAYPKPGKRHTEVTRIAKQSRGCKFILLSGTPTPESYSQMFHQLNFIPNNPFSAYVNFYKFAKTYVVQKQKRIGSMMVNDYSEGKKDILYAVASNQISFTQEKAGFTSKVTEHFLTCKMMKRTKDMIEKLKKDRVIEGQNETILADTPVKLLSKVHQMSGGTIKFDSGAAMVIDNSKANFIRDEFATKKIAIFYKFKAELTALKDAFGDTLTTDLDEFNTTSKNIALQIVSGREGISLKEADCLVMYNVDFSATSYWQSRDRLTTKEREENHVYWIFTDCGIEKEVYNAVSKKKDYTLAYFKEKHLYLNNQKNLF